MHVPGICAGLPEALPEEDPPRADPGAEEVAEEDPLRLLPASLPPPPLPVRSLFSASRAFIL